MKIVTASASVAAVLLAPAGAFAGEVSYHWTADTEMATPGDTVTLTLHASIDPQADPFHGLAAGVFDILIADMPGGGSATITGAGLGLAPSFVAYGSNGSLVGGQVLGVEAAQLPAFMNPGINLDTELPLYTMTYTVMDAAPRTILFDVAPESSTMYTNGQGLSMPYLSDSTPFALQVGSVPAPGALALLGMAGVLANRGRRRSA